MRYAFLPKCTGRKKTSRQLPYPRHEMPSQGCRHRAPTCLCKSMWTPLIANSNAAPKHTKSRLTHGKESQCARRLNDWTARKGGLGRMGYMLGANFSFNELNAAISFEEVALATLFNLGALNNLSPVYGAYITITYAE